MKNKKPAYKDLTGMRFGVLTVLELAGTHENPCGTRRSLWRCRCDCGTEKVVQGTSLTSGQTVSCGCMKKIRIAKINTTHGGSRSGKEDRLYGIWKNMRRRCNSPKDSHYKSYGGRGVAVCEEWNDYAVFKEWAYENGYNENAEIGECTLDRIDNDGNYEPSNCRWANRIVQMNNTSRNHYVELNGTRLTIAEFARVMNISKNKAWYYLNKFEKEGANGQQFGKASGGD